MLTVHRLQLPAVMAAMKLSARTLTAAQAENWPGLWAMAFSRPSDAL